MIGTRELRSHGVLAAVALALSGCPSTSTSPEPLPDDWGQVPTPTATCLGNGDGVIAPDEIPPVDLADDLRVAFLANAAASVALPAGWLSEDDDGLIFDLSLDRLPSAADDRQIFVGTGPTDGWYASHVTGDWQAPIDTADGLLGMFARVGDDVVLRGIATEEEGETALSYSEPVPLFRLPMEDGDSWEATVDAEGLADGIVYPSDQGASGVVSLVHKWSFTVDGEGRALLPAADLPVLRLRLVLRVEAWNSITGLFAADTARATFLVAECAGTVARLRSHPDELEPDFTTATEVLRFGLVPELIP